MPNLSVKPIQLDLHKDIAPIKPILPSQVCHCAAKCNQLKDAKFELIYS